MSSNSAGASILYLRLDQNYDPLWTPTSQLVDLDAVAQAIMTRLRLFQGEWWENLNDGTPLFQKILGKRATPNNLQTMALALSQRVSGTPFVTAVQNINISFQGPTRALTFSCTASTAFGTVPVVFQPGAAAGVVTA